MSYTLRIEHPIVDFETWEAAFDRDPAGRERSGVRRYRVFRPEDDPNYVLIDLDFRELAEARAFLVALERVWSRADLSPGLARDSGLPTTGPRARIVVEVRAETYG